MTTQASLRSENGVLPLEAVLCTDELNRRPTRAPDYEMENRALVSLVEALVESPQTILQSLADSILIVLKAGSAGISLLTKDEQRFYWPVIVGQWKSHIGGGTPRDFGPCGDVLDHNAPLMFKHIERRYTYFLPVTPPVEECLLVPFYVDGKAVGTIWAVAHDKRRKFDSEDMRQLTSLGMFAAAAYQTVASLDATEKQEGALRQNRSELAHSIDELKKASAQAQDSRRAALNLMEDAVRSREELQTLNAELHKSEARKTEFMAMLGHELRNPLAAIVNSVEVLNQISSQEPDAREMRGIVERQSRYMKRMIDDLLDVARIASGKIVLHHEPIDLKSLVRRTIDDHRHHFEANGLTFAVELSKAPIWVSGDETRLFQIVKNLLHNATKFTDPGGNIVVRAKPENGSAVISVTDSGIGMEEAVLESMFEPFRQADASLARTRGGIGLGLAVSKQLALDHGGDLTAQSEGLGLGSTFILRLPLAQPVAPLPQANKLETVSVAKSHRILVVDDTRDGRLPLVVLLRRLGQDVAEAENGESAVTTAKEFRPDMILCDIGLPGMDGFAVAKAIRANPETATVELIAVTGYGQEKDREEAKQAGFDRHLTKPIGLDDLKQLLLHFRESHHEVVA
jgi:signal transduction histidine kinase/ActR/RegA family two-component response regulator